MSELWIPIVVQLLILVGSLVALRQARGKTKAEAWHEEAKATLTITQAAELAAKMNREQIDRLRADLGSALGTIDEFNQRLQKVLEDKRYLDARASMLDKKAGELSEGLRRQSEHLADLQLAYDQIRRDMQALRAENAQLRDLRVERDKEIEQMKADLKMLHAENEELRKALVARDKEIGQLKKRIEELEK